MINKYSKKALIITSMVLFCYIFAGFALGIGLSLEVGDGVYFTDRDDANYHVYSNGWYPIAQDFHESLWRLYWMGVIMIFAVWGAIGIVVLVTTDW